VTRRAPAAAAARKALWRTVLALTGGLRVHGAAALPPGPCVTAANHQSHADTVALIAALPGPAAASRRRGGGLLVPRRAAAVDLPRAVRGIPGAAHPGRQRRPGRRCPAARGRARRDHLPRGNTITGRADRGLPPRRGPPRRGGRRAARARRDQRHGNAAAAAGWNHAPAAAHRGDRAHRRPCQRRDAGRTPGQGQPRCRDRRNRPGSRASDGAGGRSVRWPDGPPSGPRARSSSSQPLEGPAVLSPAIT